jgi:hypothetical protein
MVELLVQGLGLSRMIGQVPEVSFGVLVRVEVVDVQQPVPVKNMVLVAEEERLLF